MDSQRVLKRDGVSWVLDTQSQFTVRLVNLHLERERCELKTSCLKWWWDEGRRVFRGSKARWSENEEKVIKFHDLLYSSLEGFCFKQTTSGRGERVLRTLINQRVAIAIWVEALIFRWRNFQMFPTKYRVSQWRKRRDVLNIWNYKADQSSKINEK